MILREVGSASKKSKEARASIACPGEMQKKLEKVSIFFPHYLLLQIATLGRPKKKVVVSGEEDALDLSSKLQTCQLPTKFLGHSSASAELQRTLAGYDGLPEDHLKWLLRGVEVPIKALPSGPLTIIIVGDSTLSSLNVYTTFTNLDKQCKAGLRTYLSLFSPLGSTGVALGERRLVGQVKAMLGEVVGERVVVGLCLGSAPEREKRNPMETAANLGTLHDQFCAEVRHSSQSCHVQGMSCFILGLVPVLVEEVRGAAYSSCWSSQVLQPPGPPSPPGPTQPPRSITIWPEDVGSMGGPISP